MVRDIAPTSYVFEKKKHAHTTIPLRFSSLQKHSLLTVFLTHIVWNSCHFSDRICGIVILLAVSGMDFSLCQPPWAHLIASNDHHGKCVRCVGLAHARDALFRISNCKYCENFTLKTLLDSQFLIGICRSSLPHRSGGLLPMRSSGLEFGCGARGYGG